MSSQNGKDCETTAFHNSFHRVSRVKSAFPSRFFEREHVGIENADRKLGFFGAGA
jgi:hypothetical protein